MSQSFDRGRTFERKVASMIRKKLGARIERDRRSGAGVNRSDISDYYQEIPLHLEIKDQETLKPKEWFRQADQASSMNMTPSVVFHMDEEIMVMLRFSDLLNFLCEIQDQKAEIDDLREPHTDEFPPATNPIQAARRFAEAATAPIVKKKIQRGQKTCRNGHLADEFGYCQILSCKYSRGYKPPKKAR